MIAKLVRRVRNVFQPVPKSPQPPGPLAPNHSDAHQTEMKARALRAMNQESTRRLYIDLERIRTDRRFPPWEGS